MQQHSVMTLCLMRQRVVSMLQQVLDSASKEAVQQHQKQDTASSDVATPTCWTGWTVQQNKQQKQHQQQIKAPNFCSNLHTTFYALNTYPIYCYENPYCGLTNCVHADLVVEVVAATTSFFDILSLSRIASLSWPG